MRRSVVTLNQARASLAGASVFADAALLAILSGVTLSVGVASEKADTVFAGGPSGAIPVAITLECAHPLVAVTCLTAKSIPWAVAAVSTFSADGGPAGKDDKRREKQDQAIHQGVYLT